MYTRDWRRNGQNEGWAQRATNVWKLKALEELKGPLVRKDISTPVHLTSALLFSPFRKGEHVFYSNVNCIPAHTMEIPWKIINKRHRHTTREVGVCGNHRSAYQSLLRLSCTYILYSYGCYLTTVFPGYLIRGAQVRILQLLLDARTALMRARTAGIYNDKETHVTESAVGLNAAHPTASLYQSLASLALRAVRPTPSPFPLTAAATHVSSSKSRYWILSFPTRQVKRVCLFLIV